MSVGSLARVASALLLAASLSGVAGLVASALDRDCCEERCDGALDGKTCPPRCTQGECAKTSPTVENGATLVLRAPGPTARGSVAAAAAPELPVVVHGLFRPPIA